MIVVAVASHLALGLSSAAGLTAVITGSWNPAFSAVSQVIELNPASSAARDSAPEVIAR